MLQIPVQTLTLTVNPELSIRMKLQTKKRRSSILFTQGRRKKKKPETGKTIPKDSDS